MSRYRARFHDPEGRRHNGFPTFAWRCAPEGLATRRQLSRLGLRPAGQQPVAQVKWSRGRGRAAGVAYLYDVALALPKREMTEGRWRTVNAMIRVRSTCKKCGTVAAYCLPRSLGRICLACAEAEGLVPC